MSSAQIMVVEDEGLVTLELKETLKRLGYTVSAIASNGKEAIEKAICECPDLILMDIRLNGSMDGIETALRLKEIYSIPIIYLTADLNDKNLERVKQTDSFGCILKPFDEKTLRATIEISLAHAQKDRQQKEEKEWSELILKNLEWGIMATDCKGVITHINQIACQLLNNSEKNLIGKRILEVISFIDKQTGLPEKIPISKAILENETITIRDCLFSTPMNEKLKAEYNLKPLKNKNGNTIGTLLFFKIVQEK